MSYLPASALQDSTGPADAVDLRSDTVTRPDAAMRAAMAAAEVGDDVYGDDPTVAALEREVALRLGMAAAAFFPSGTQSNLAAILAHCGRGDEALVGRGYHVQSAEACGASVLGGVALDPLEVLPDGGVAAPAVTAAVKPEDNHCPVTKLLCLENTVAGRAVPLSSQDAAVAAARAAGLAVHLDGARLFNAAQALGVAPKRLTCGVDSVSVCLSKGLGAPAGTVLCGDAHLIAAARRWRKMLGGGMRQSGVLAAAGLHALAHNLAGLAHDHARAARLREALAHMPGLEVDLGPGQTNMVWAKLDKIAPGRLQAGLRHHGILVSPGAASLRLALHRDVDDAALDRAITAFGAVLTGLGRPKSAA